MYRCFAAPRSRAGDLESTPSPGGGAQGQAQGQGQGAGRLPGRLAHSSSGATASRATHISRLGDRPVITRGMMEDRAGAAGGGPGSGYAAPRPSAPAPPPAPSSFGTDADRISSSSLIATGTVSAATAWGGMTRVSTDERFSSSSLPGGVQRVLGGAAGSSERDSGGSVGTIAEGAAELQDKVCKVPCAAIEPSSFAGAAFNS